MIGKMQVLSTITSELFDGIPVNSITISNFLLEAGFNEAGSWVCKDITYQPEWVTNPPVLVAELTYKYLAIADAIEADPQFYVLSRDD